MAEKRGKILIVEDEVISAAVLNNILNDNYTLHMSPDGQTALQSAVDVHPDVILLDINLPGKLNGIDVLTKLKNSDKTKDIPIIITTGDTTQETKITGLKLGAVDYITKPYELIETRLRIDNQMTLVERTKQLQEQIALTSIDHLTSLHNRYYFDLRLGEEWKRAIREKIQLSLLMVDIDFFKRYNDTYGHLQGDEALKAVAAVLKGVVKRPGDLVARWGGEEFVALLPATGGSGSLYVAENIRKGIEQAVIMAKDEKTSITASIGVNTCKPTRGCHIEEFIKNADSALYSAKENGRNRAWFHDRRVEDNKRPKIKLPSEV